MKNFVPYIIVVLLILTIVLLDNLNINNSKIALSFIQNKLSEFENNIKKSDCKANDCLLINHLNELNEKEINLLSDWGMVDAKDILNKRFIINNTGWYWIIHKNDKTYILKFKYIYPVNNQFLFEHYAECLNLSNEFKLIYSEQAKQIKVNSYYIPFKLVQFPKYKSKLLLNINACLFIIWFLLLQYLLLFQLSTHNIWWHWIVTGLINILRCFFDWMKLLGLIKESLIFNAQIYAYPKVLLLSSFGNVLITLLSIFLLILFTNKKSNRFILLMNIILCALLLFMCIYLFTHYSSFTLNINSILFFTHQNLIFSLLSIVIILFLAAYLSYLIDKFLFKDIKFYRLGLNIILILLFITWIIHFYQKQSLYKKVEDVFLWIEHEEQLSLFEQCQIIEKKLSDLNSANDSLYFQKISGIENATIYLQLSKRYLFEDATILNNYLIGKKNILSNTFVDDIYQKKSQNNLIENIYYVNKFDKKYLLSVFEYSSPFNNKIDFNFLSDNIFQLPSGFKDFQIAAYSNQNLKFKISSITFSSELPDISALKNLYPDYVFYSKQLSNQIVIIAHKDFSFKIFISFFSSYFILFLSIVLILAYFYFAIKYRHLFPFRHLPFIFKITLLVVIISVISFYLLFYFSFIHFNQFLNNEIKNQLLKQSQTYNPNSTSNVFMYKIDGTMLKPDYSNLLIKFKLIPAQLTNNILQNALSHKIYFDRKKIGVYEYSVLYTLKNLNNQPIVTEFSFFDELSFKETNLQILLNLLFNIYTFLFLIIFFIGVFVSDYIVFPIRKISTELKNKVQPFELNPIAYPYNDELGELVHNYNILIQRLEKALEQLKKEQQEKAWKLMAQQVAHDIKNSLTPLLLNIEYLKKQNQNDIKFQKILDTIVFQIQILSKTSEDFSEYANELTVNIEKINSIETIEKILTQYETYSDIQINIHYDAHQMFVYTDAYLLSRVITNLINNSIDAMNNNGIIDISVFNENDNIVISVKDNGCGIPEEIQDKIFEPKFSTKTSGKGLGLSIVKNICDKLNIQISFQSVKNKGTVFYLKIKI